MEEDKELIEFEKKESWRKALVADTRGVIMKTPDNIIAFLENHPDYAGKLRYNEYLRMKEYDGHEFTDFDQSDISNDIFRNLGFNNRGWVEDALNSVFNRHRYNPVVDYIKSVKWDGKKRIESIFIDLLEADDTDLNRKMTRKWMVAAVKRTLIPGCKFDNMIVLQGAQGIGKSSICERLARGFFSTISLEEIGNKDIIDKMNKTWIAIIDEMDTFNKKEMSSVKTFLSQVKDTTRLAYARNVTNFDRHCIFIGSTNDDTFLRDTTSSVERRFWIIKCNKTKMDNKIRKIMTDEYVDQLWAEAYHYYTADPDQYLDMDQDMMEEFARVQSQYKTFNDDEIVDFVKDALDREYVINAEGEVTDIDQINNTFASGPKYHINKIPGFILTQLIQQKFKTQRGTKYLEAAMGGGWRYTNARYKKLDGKVIRSWIRVTPLKEEHKKYDPMDEFTVSL